MSRPVPGQEGPYDEHLQLERLDGTPADPPSFKTTVLPWNPGDRIHIAAGRTLQVVRIRHDGPTSPLSWSSRTCPKERLAPWPLSG
jgi:hypothetical protein